ncbi:MAG: mechanosensitive ion channel family protein [Crocosphaera sp.]|nr:mechanosensitive ion channel family protein [Crocosphaera sp.]
MLTITWTPRVVGQFPVAVSSGDTPIKTQTPWWDPNKAESCGRLWCSTVHLFGGLDKFFQVAVNPATLENPNDSAFIVEERAKKVQRIYDSIYDRVRESESKVDRDKVTATISNIGKWKNLFFERDNLGVHPVTPKIEVGIRNDQTVVYVPEQLDLGLSGQIIVTISRADTLHYGKSVEDIAQTWRFLIFESLNEALWAYEIDRYYPFARWLIAALIIFVIAIFVIILWVIRYSLKSWNRRLTRQLRTLEKSLAIDAEGLTNEEVSLSDNLENNGLNYQESESKEKNNKTNFLSLAKKAINNPEKVLFKAKKVVDNTVQNISYNLSHVSLKQQSSIKRQQNIVLLLSGLLFWIQIFLILLTGGLIVLIFPETRRYSYFFLGQALTIPLIWMSVGIANKLLNLLIDYYLNKWAKNEQLIHPNSNRYTLRVSTYSNALKSGATFLCIAIGIAITVMLLGINLTVLASAGGVAFVVAFLSRNVVEDMLNGILILWTDRYAIGDVIQVGTIGGLVENMNIYITQIRGAEGRLVTIPNSKISIVENLTKDWSRVEFKIEIAYDADVRKALNVISEVSEEMQNDPTWKDKMIEPAAILGVDDISHQGLLIQVWIKTQAMQQWAVGREYRLRIKEAFEAAGIDIGVPHQEVRYQASLLTEN